MFTKAPANIGDAVPFSLMCASPHCCFFVGTHPSSTPQVVLITFMFCPAIPLLLPFAALFMSFSYFVDKYNLMRVFKPPPRTTERSVAMSVLYLLPAAVFGHVWMALFFYSKQAGLPHAACPTQQSAPSHSRVAGGGACPTQ